MDWKWLSEHAAAEWRVLTDAPGATAIMVAVIALVLWAALKWAYESVVTQKDAAISGQQTTITNLNGTVADLRAEITSLRTKLADKSIPPGPETPQAVQRDPDGVYQFGRQVGSVTAARVSLATGSVMFERIYNAANLDAEKEFEYRDFKLRIRQTGAETRAVIAGGPPQRMLGNVVCAVVGRC